MGDTVLRRCRWSGNVVYGIAVYPIIQFLETQLIMPIVQERTTRLPPGLTLGIQLIAGMVFGLLGVTFALPLAAAAKIMIGELYVRDCLGGPWRKREHS